ncbi:MAG: DUF5686 family protein [Ignavibacteriae bacterium]|nr:DUF5686 family protein [Ignavibacteriota bacterium]
MNILYKKPSKIYYLLLISLIFSSSAYSQNHKITGRVFDIKTYKPLSFATIKIADSTYGTTSDEDGRFIIKVKKGYYTLLTSYIGFHTDTANFLVEDTDVSRELYLRPNEFTTDVIEVEGEDPAYDIIRKAIKYKKEFKLKLREYNYDAFSKFVIRSNVNPFNEEKGKPKDTLSKGENPIFGILESETKGYFKQPDLEKQIVISKRETANISRGFAIPLIVNFYDEKIDLGQIKIPGPLGDDAFDNYEYKLTGTSMIDSITVFKIKVINTSNQRPLFLGNIYILDSLYALLKIDLETNGSEVIRGIDKLSFKQRFTNFPDKKKEVFWMPTDIQIYADGSFAGFIKFRGEVFSIVSNYNLNEKAPPGIFDEFIVKVLPDAKKDSIYWRDNQLIKNTDEEKRAYKNIEVSAIKRSGRISITPWGVNYGKYFSTNFFEMYRFSNIAGSDLRFNLNYSNNLNRITASSFLGYGFSDKKSRFDVSGSARLLYDRSLLIRASLFKKPVMPFMSDTWGAVFQNTINTLFYKEELFYYYYSSGLNLRIAKTIIPQIRIGLNYTNEKQTIAYNTTDYSFFYKDNTYRQNPPINETFRRSIGADLRLDPNDYKAIDWGDGDISRFPVTQFPSLTVGFDYSGKSLGSTLENRKFYVNIFGHQRINNYINIKYRLGAVFLNGSVPFQNLASFNVTNLGTAEGLAFNTMKYGEYLGNKIYFINFENDFGKFLIGNIPIIRNFRLIGIFNAGRSEISADVYDFSAYKNFKSTDGYFVEAGFGIGRILELFRINLAWRLNNNLAGNNFMLNLTFDNQ